MRGFASPADGERSRLPEGISRRAFLVGGGTLAGAALLGQALPGGTLRRLGPQALGPTAAHASPVELVLDTAKPLASFLTEGSEPYTPSPTVLNLNDRSISDIIHFYSKPGLADSLAAPGIGVDVVATFQVVAGTPGSADGGVRFIINDGQANAVVAVCIIKDGLRRIGLAADTRFSDPANYPVFAEADWTGVITVRLRRTAQGDGQIVEINGVPLTPPPTLPYVQLPPRSRLFPSVEFGCQSVEATANVNFTEFRAVSLVTFAAQVQPPINADGTSTFSANRGIVPLKFTLTENGVPTCGLPAATLRLTRTGGAAPGPIDESLYTGSADSGSIFRIADCQYHHNVNARALGPGSYLAEILIDGALVGGARFELK